MNGRASHRRRADGRAAGDVERDVEAVAELYPALYLRLHRRRPRGGLRPDGQMLAVLSHLAMAGPLTVGEAARHMDRAQSVMSELVDRLAAHGLAERMPDARDRRRVLVWLTPAGEQALREEGEVLSRERLRAALGAMPSPERAALVRGMRALVAAAERVSVDEIHGGGGTQRSWGEGVSPPSRGGRAEPLSGEHGAGPRAAGVGPRRLGRRGGAARPERWRSER